MAAGASEDRSYSERSKALVCRNLFRESSALLQLGRFELVRTIGRGSTGVVYEALDPARQRRVALKMLHRNGPSELYRLKREFRSLSELRHTNLVSLHELHVTASEAYFTMDLVDGQDFVSAIRRAAAPGAPPEGEAAALLWSALSELCSGVQALHDADKLHRDLKPANVLVTGAGRVVLLDFGLVHDAHDATTSGAGTPGYMAPEQRAGCPVRASDWYSVGVMLGEALGFAPVHGGAEDNALFPLAELAARLVHPDPAERPSFDAIQAVLQRRAAPARPSPSPVRSPFEGRHRELSALDVAVQASRREPVFTIVSGDSGIGKSALLREFATRQLLPRGALVLRGRCYERESIPYKGLDAVVDALTLHLHALCDGTGALPDGAPALPGDELAVLLQTFPVLGRVHFRTADPGSTAALSPGGVVTGSTAGKGAKPLRAILGWLASRHPLVLMIDDLQWADVDSARLLASLLCDDDSPPMLVVATDRKRPSHEDGVGTAFSRAAAEMPRPIPIRELELAPLSAEETLALAHGLLASGKLRDRAGEIATEAQGNPLFVTELARWLASSAADARPTRGVDALFDQRRAALRESSRSLLELIAVAGRPLSLAVLAHVAGSGAGPIEELDELMGAHLVRSAPSAASATFEVAHDRIASSVTERLDPAYKMALHVRLARAFERIEGEDSEALVEQYAGAGMPIEAARSARKAAARALSVFAFARAAALCERALSLGAWSAVETADLHRDRAISLVQIGRGLEAARSFERAAVVTADPIVAASFVHQAVQQLLHHGDFRGGTAMLQRGYRALGLGWPESRAALVLSIAFHSIPRRLRDWRRKKGGPAAEVLERARAEFLTGAGRGIENYDALRAVHNALLCFDSAERLDDPVWQARAAGARGMMRCFGLASGGTARGLAELRAAYEAAERANDDGARADIGRQLAATLIILGDPRAGLVAATASEESYRRLPAPTTELNVGVGFKGAALVQLGRLREARRYFNAITHEIRTHRDLRTTTYVHGHPARFAILYAGEQRSEVQDTFAFIDTLRSGNPDYRTLAFMSATNRLEAALYWGTLDDVERIARREGPVLFGTGYGLLSDEARFLRARINLLRAAQSSRGESRRWLRAAASDARWRRRGTGSFLRARVLLLEAGIAQVAGRTEKALCHLQEAAGALRSAGADRTIPVVEYCRGAVLGGDEGYRLRRSAGAALRDEGVVQPARWVRWIVGGFQLEDESHP